MVEFRRVDTVHAAIRQAARAAGYGWIDTSNQGDGCPDAFCLSRGGRWLAIEIKSPGGRLTAAQKELWSSMPNAPWAIVHSFEELVAKLEELDQC